MPKKASKTSGRKKKIPTRNIKRKSLWPLATGCILITFACCVVFLILGAGTLYIIDKSKKESPLYSQNPKINITKPTSHAWYTTSQETIILSGIASDEENQLEKVEWVKEDSSPKTALGTSNWKTDKIQLTQGENQLTLIAYDKDGNHQEDKIKIIYNPQVNFTKSLSAFPNFLQLEDKPREVKFNVSVQSDKSIETIKLFKTDENGQIIEEVGSMYDNGNPENGDDIPGDGTYGTVELISTDKLEPIYFKALVNIEKDTHAFSEPVKINSVKLTEEGFFIQIENFNSHVIDLKNRLVEQNLTQRKISRKIADWVCRQEIVRSCGLSEHGNGVWWLLTESNIPGGLFINSSDTKGDNLVLTETSQKPLVRGVNTNTFSRSVDTVGNIQAIYLGPFNDEFGKSDEYYGSWEKVKQSKCPKYKLTEKLDHEVTVEEFKNLYKYGIIIISSHGDNWFGTPSATEGTSLPEIFSQSQSVIKTRQKVTLENFRVYEGDILTGRLAVSADGYYVILPSFIENYNAYFPDSLVYVSTCRSTYNTDLASAFLGSGAQTFIGYDEYITVEQSYNSGSRFFESFVLKNSSVRASLSTLADSNFNFYGSEELVTGGFYFINSGFEEERSLGWTVSGDSRVVSSLGSIKPTEGEFFAIVSTGLGSVSVSTSSISQSICYKKGDKLVFDYNLVSEEPTEYLNTTYDDTLSVKLIVNGTEYEVLTQGINESEWQDAGNINFDGGDDTTYKSGWKRFEYSLPNLQPDDQIEIIFQVSDIGDSAYDTAALIDNFRIE